MKMNETNSEEDLYEKIEESLNEHSLYPSDWINANKAFDFKEVKGGKLPASNRPAL